MAPCGTSSASNEPEVGGEPEAVPVRDITLRDGGFESLRLGDRPVREQSAAAAAGDAHTIRIDVSSLQQLVDAGHQIFIVVTRVVVLDDVAELLAVRACCRADS